MEHNSKPQGHRFRDLFQKKFALHWESSAGNRRVKMPRKLHQEYVVDMWYSERKKKKLFILYQNISSSQSKSLFLYDKSIKAFGGYFQKGFANSNFCCNYI